IRFVLATFVIAFGLNLLNYLTSFFIEFDYGNWWNSFVIMALTVYLISIPGFAFAHQVPALKFEPNRKGGEVKSAPTVLPEVEQWKQKLHRLMEKEQPYLDPDLTLQQLSEKLRTNTSILSKAINSGFGQNFNNYINEYRVNAMREKMVLPKYRNYTLVSIAFECGFNSKATFNRAFKKFTGMSPKTYLDQQLTLVTIPEAA
ncbi:MAG: helix-turn-helix domain-containing protein, partial [Saprospiraceae bacterium]